MTFPVNTAAQLTDGFEVGDVVDVTYEPIPDGTDYVTDIEYVENDSSGIVTSLSAGSMTIIDDSTGQPDVFYADPNAGMFLGIGLGDEVDVTWHQGAIGMVADNVRRRRLVLRRAVARKTPAEGERRRGGRGRRGRAPLVLVPPLRGRRRASARVASRRRATAAAIGTQAPSTRAQTVSPTRDLGARRNPGAQRRQVGVGELEGDRARPDPRSRPW